MRGPLGKRGRLWLGTGLLVLPVGVVVLLWLGGASPWGRRSPVGATPDVGERVRPRLAARGPGGRSWLRDPAAPRPLLNRECPVSGDCVVDFSYRDEQLLGHGQGGGRVWIPAVARERGGQYPLVVLLHGTAPKLKADDLHRLLAPPLDLSLEFKKALGRGEAVPVLVAAPSQTRHAQASPTLWTRDGFDLADFVTVLEAELRALGSVRVDRREVSVFGHSGAGCVVTPRERNGLFHVAERVGALRKLGVHVVVLGLMDICFHGYGGGRFLRAALAGTSTRVAAMWVEPETWFSALDRDLEGFSKGLGITEPAVCDRSRFETCLENDRGWWLFKARRPRLIQEIESRSPNPPGGVPLEAHSTVTRWFVQQALRRHFSRKSKR
jgi:hypothetical protein